MDVPIALVVVAIVAWIVKFLLNHFNTRLPPGPWGLPLVGYKPFLKDAFGVQSLELQKKYGKIFGFWNGAIYTVVLNDFEDIKDAFNREEFLHRPAYFKLHNQDNIITMNGWKWKETRRFTLTTLRNLGMGGNRMEDAIKDEITRIIDKLEKPESSKEADIYEILHPPLLNIIFFLICGKIVDEDRIVSLVEKYSEKFLQGMTDLFLRHFYPFLRPYLFIKSLLKKQLIKGDVEIETFLWNQISAHEKRYDENYKDDFMDYYIDEMKKRLNQKTAITRENLFGNSLALLLAGVDTTRVTSTWMFILLAQYQKEQAKVYAEIADVLGEKAPSWSDRESLPYLNAFIMEVARFKTLAPAADPHCAAVDGTISDYFIPKGATIFGNILAVHMDKKLWGDPENFRPERFLSVDRKKCVQPEHWMPFLTGKRACPGEKLASMQLFMFVSSVVQKFKVLPPESGLNSESFEMILTYPVKSKVAFVPRS